MRVSAKKLTGVPITSHQSHTRLLNNPSPPQALAAGIVLLRSAVELRPNPYRIGHTQARRHSERDSRRSQHAGKRSRSRQQFKVLPPPAHASYAPNGVVLALKVEPIHDGP